MTCAGQGASASAGSDPSNSSTRDKDDGPAVSSGPGTVSTDPVGADLLRKGRRPPSGRKRKGEEDPPIAKAANAGVLHVTFDIVL